MGRRLVPLLLLAVLTVGAAAAAYGGGQGQDGFVSGSAAAASVAAGGSPALLQQIERATAQAGTAQFTFTSKTTNSGATAPTPSRGFGVVDFPGGRSNVYSVLTIAEPALAGGTPTTVSQSEQRIDLPTGTYETVESETFTGGSSGWVTMPDLVKADSSPLQALINGNPGTLGLALALASGAKREGTATVSGVATRTYRLTTPSLSCTSAAGEKLGFDSVLTADVDRHDRIRQIEQHTFVRFQDPTSRGESVVGLTSQLDITAFGHPVSISAPAAVQPGGRDEFGKFSGAQCATLNGVFSSAFAAASASAG
jgi:hypothetical protein